MGIRYFALSIDLEDYEHLRVGTCPTCGEEPQLRDVEEEDERRTSLDLDKAWGILQWVLRTEPPRPAAALVEGRVKNAYWGWRSHRGILSPSEVKDVAADLATVTPDFLHQRIVIEGLRGTGAGDRADEDFEYTSEYLERAQEFVRLVADEDRAIVYYIG